MDWLKANWKKILPFAVLLLTAISGVTGYQIGIRPAQPGEKPGVIIVIPGEDPEPLISGTVMAPSADEKPHPLLRVARNIAGRRYARQHDIPAATGVSLANGVPYVEIESAAKASGLNVFGLSYETNSRGEVVGGPLIDWLKVPGNLEKLISLIMMLIPLFADAGIDVMPLLQFLLTVAV